jgi:hypothetical protein
MNLKAVLASLILGSSSLAMAAPAVTVSAQASYGTTVRDHRSDDSRPIFLPAHPVALPAAYDPALRPLPAQPVRHVPPQVYRPVTLASGLHFASRNRTFITVGNQAGRFGSLQISAAGGRTFIQQVYVEFENGQEQVIRNLNRTLTGNDSLTLDLAGDRRGIRRIVVYGNDIHTGWRRSATGFTVTAA